MTHYLVHHDKGILPVTAETASDAVDLARCRLPKSRGFRSYPCTLKEFRVVEHGNREAEQIKAKKKAMRGPHAGTS